MKRYGNLYEKICSLDNIMEAHRNARKNKTHYSEVRMVDKNPEYYCNCIRESLLNHTYTTSEYKVFTKYDKGKNREIYKLPYYPDRIVHWAIMQVIEPILMKTFITSSCASIPNRGIHQALEIETKMLDDEEGTKYCLKLDVSKFFPSIDQDVLLSLLTKKFKDPELLNLFANIVHSVDHGVPIGNYLSQYFANYYLTYFDHWVKEVLKVKYYVRYMDDIVIFGSDKTELLEIFYRINEYFRINLKLTIKKNWQIFPTRVRGVDFLGYRHYGNYILLRKHTYRQFVRRCLEISRKDTLTDSDYSSLNSYLGWLSWCNGYTLAKKYIDPITQKIIDYEKARNRKKSCLSKYFNRKVSVINGKILRLPKLNKSSKSCPRTNKCGCGIKC